MAARPKIEVKFAFERSTKNTYRFQELSDDPVIGVLYVQKRAFSRLPREVQLVLLSDDLLPQEGNESGQ